MLGGQLGGAEQAATGAAEVFRSREEGGQQPEKGWIFRKQGLIKGDEDRAPFKGYRCRYRCGGRVLTKGLLGF